MSRIFSQTNTFVLFFSVERGEKSSSIPVLLALLFEVSVFSLDFTEVLKQANTIPL